MLVRASKSKISGGLPLRSQTRENYVPPPRCAWAPPILVPSREVPQKFCSSKLKRMSSVFVGILLFIASIMGGERSAGAMGEVEGVQEGTRELYEAIHENASHTNLVQVRKKILADLGLEMERLELQRKQRQQEKILEGELAKRLQELAVLQEQLTAVVAEKANQNPNVPLLVSLYESLSPENAAELLKRLPVDVAVRIVQTMKLQKSSKIIGVMEPAVAAKLSRLILRTPQPDKAAEQTEAQ